MATKTGTSMQLSYIPLRFVPARKLRVPDLDILRKLKREGKTADEIGKFFACSAHHVRNFVRRYGLPPFDNVRKPKKNVL